MRATRRRTSKVSGGAMRSSVAGSSRAAPDAFWSRQTRAWLVVAAVLALAGCVGSAWRRAFSQRMTRRRHASGVRGILGAGRVDAEARDPARAGSNRRRGRVPCEQPACVERAVRALDGGGTRLSTLPRAARTWARGDRPGIGARRVREGGRARSRRPAVRERDLPGRPPGRRPFYCFARQEAWAHRAAH